MKVKRANRIYCQGELSVDLHDTKGNVDHIQCNGDQSAYLCNELRIGLSTRYVKNTFLKFQDSLHCRICVEGKHGTAVVVQCMKEPSPIRCLSIYQIGDGGGSQGFSIYIVI
jgi:hypothetical protein